MSEKEKQKGFTRMPKIGKISLEDFLSEGDINQNIEKINKESIHSDNINKVIETEKQTVGINDHPGNEIEKLKNELIKEKNNSQKLITRIKELEKQIKEEKEKNKKLLIKIEDLNKKNQELNNLIENNNNKDNIINLMNKIITKDEEIRELKSQFPFELLKGEKLMTVIFSTENQDFLYSIICKNTDKFTKIENILYDEFPGYKQTQNDFMFNGQKIDKYKTLDENNIYNSAVILLVQIQ